MFFENGDQTNPNQGTLITDIYSQEIFFFRNLKLLNMHKKLFEFISICFKWWNLGNRITKLFAAKTNIITSNTNIQAMQTEFQTEYNR